MVYVVAIVLSIVFLIVGIALIAAFHFERGWGTVWEIVGILLVLVSGATAYILIVPTEMHASWKRNLQVPQNYYVSAEAQDTELQVDELRWDPIPNALWIAVTVTRDDSDKTTYVLPGNATSFEPVEGKEVSISYGTAGGPSVLRKRTVSP